MSIPPDSKQNSSLKVSENIASSGLRPVGVVAVLLVVTLEMFTVKTWFVTNFHFGHILLVSFLISFIITPEIREFARKTGVVDNPGGRKTQKKPIPLLGGMAVFIAFGLAIFQNLNFTIGMKAMCFGATIIFVLGLLDDTVGLMAHTKLLGQISAVLIMTNMGYWGGSVKQVVIIIWVVGVTNAFNFLDGMDGLAAGLGVIASLWFTVLAMVTGQLDVAIVTTALAGACLGFLVFNFRPATIYLGDAGSTVIGFLLASVGVIGGWHFEERNLLVSLGVPCMILSILIFDLLMTTILRFKEGKVKTIPELLAYTGRDHVHHRIEKAGFSVVQTVLILYCVAILTGGLAIGFRLMSLFWQQVTCVSLGVIVLLALRWMHNIEKKHLLL